MCPSALLPTMTAGHSEASCGVMAKAVRLRAMSTSRLHQACRYPALADLLRPPTPIPGYKWLLSWQRSRFCGLPGEGAGIQREGQRARVSRLDSTNISDPRGVYPPPKIASPPSRSPPEAQQATVKEEAFPQPGVLPLPEQAAGTSAPLRLGDSASEWPCQSLCHPDQKGWPCWSQKPTALPTYPNPGPRGLHTSTSFRNRSNKGQRFFLLAPSAGLYRWYHSRLGSLQPQSNGPFWKGTVQTAAAQRPRPGETPKTPGRRMSAAGRRKGPRPTGVRPQGFARRGRPAETVSSLRGSSVPFRRSVVTDSLRPRGLQYTRLPWPLPTPGAYSSSCPLSR